MVDVDRAIEIAITSAAPHAGANGKHEPMFCGRCAIDSIRIALSSGPAPAHLRDQFPKGKK